MAGMNRRTLLKRSAGLVLAATFGAGVGGTLQAAPSLATTPPAKRVCCIGDSVTWGLTATGSPEPIPTPWGGYRGHLWTPVWEQYDVRPVGSRTDPLKWGGHEGHGGLRIPQATAMVPRIVADYDPHIVIAMLGTAHFLYDPLGYGLASWEQALTDMVAFLCAIETHRPGTETLLCTPPISRHVPDAELWTRTWWQGLPQAAQRARVASGAHVRVVHASEALVPATDLSDLVGHPTDDGATKLGYVKIAEAIKAALVPILEAA